MYTYIYKENEWASINLLCQDIVKTKINYLPIKKLNYLV